MFFISTNLPQAKGVIARAESQPLARGKLEGIHEQGKTEWQLHKGGCASQRDKTKLEQKHLGEGGGVIRHTHTPHIEGSNKEPDGERL